MGMNNNRKKNTKGYAACDAEDLTVDIIHNPDKKFRGSKREKILDKITEIALDGFGTNISRADHENHTLKDDICCFIKNEGDIVGYAGYKVINVLEGKKVCYLDGIVVKRDFQKRGAFHKVNKLILSEGDFDFFVARTQSPIFYAATEKIVDELYPNERRSPPPKIKEVAKAIANDLLKMERFDVETLVGRATYEKCLYDVIPKHERISRFFDNYLKIDYNAGDSVLLVGKLHNSRKGRARRDDRPSNAKV